MPDPKQLRIGDRVRFISLPEEWSQPNFTTPPCSVAFMKRMIRRRFPSRIYRIDETGYPWIAARIRRRGRIEHHHWGIFESTGWRVVRRKSPPKK